MELEQTTDYPWDGKVRIKVSKGSGRYAIKLRVPSWLKSSPTNNNLYTYLDRAKPYSISVNGKAYYPENTDYITVDRKWKTGDVIDIDFPMDVRRIVANDNAEDLRGKVCLERGPIVYCLEASDQEGGSVFDKYLPNYEKLTFNAHYEPTLLGGITVIDTKGRMVKANGDVTEVDMRAVPYAVWNNRGPQQMEVWIAGSPATAVPVTELKIDN